MALATSLRGAIDAVQDAVGAVSGIRKAPDNPPDTFNVFPCAACYPHTGYYDVDLMKTAHHDLRLLILVARKDMDRDVKKTVPYGDSIRDALWDAHRTDRTIDITGRVSYGYGDVTWGGLLCVGWAFTIEGVKCIST